jgi:4a-hydroxytetrahydrobiopterin dehydratase
MKEEAKDLQPLSESEIASRLKDFPGWEYKENKLVKTLHFKDFSEGLDFLNKLIPFCNKIDHHPDVHIYFRKWIFELTRYSIGGKVTARDFTVAKKIEELCKNR